MLPAAEPRPEPDRLPRPPVVPALTTFARLGNEVVVCAPAGELRRLGRAVGPGVPGNVSLLEANRLGAVPLPDGSADLIVVPRLPALRRHARADWVERARRLLAPDGVAYVEGRFLARIDFGALLWPAPAAGEVRMAAPLADREAIAYLERRFFRRRALRRQLRRPGRVLARQAAVRRIVRRPCRPGRPSAGTPGRRTSGVRPRDRGRAGADVEHTRWAPPRRGTTLSEGAFFLFGSTGEVPDAIVKIATRTELPPRERVAGAHDPARAGSRNRRHAPPAVPGVAQRARRSG